jgi:transcriptional regulator with XRE-family HTH domain
MAVAKASDLTLPHLRLWRGVRGLTQEQLAEAAGVARGTIIRAESGGGVNVLSATKIARALGVTVKQLQTEEPE